MGQHKMVLRAGYRDEELGDRCGGGAPEELFLDPEDHDLLELQAPAADTGGHDDDAAGAR
ncbi:hypothetical protein ACIP28_29605 [Streptomyces albidoflavus]|uniref:hypothetical protein n=1 Tax=Streptomyces sp. S5 TaxID=1456735 RepID=UPI0013CED55C|nr:hypothetical protein [Streptomyces sp. S5]MBO1286133.1 hypothetical protein [Streptomyces sampsonii]